MGAWTSCRETVAQRSERLTALALRVIQKRAHGTAVSLSLLQCVSGFLQGVWRVGGFVFSLVHKYDKFRRIGDDDVSLFASYSSQTGRGGSILGDDDFNTSGSCVRDVSQVAAVSNANWAPRQASDRSRLERGHHDWVDRESWIALGYLE